MIRKHVYRKLPFILAAILIAFAINSEAQQNVDEARMDIQTQDALISKLEDLLPQLKDDKSKTVVIQTRLADLYSERARLKDMVAGETNCNECKDAVQDRNKAIRYYETVTSHANREEGQRIALQLAHLYRLNGKTQQAQNLYDRILKDKTMSPIHGKAHMGLADIAFENGDYQKAKREYSLVKANEINDKIYVTFREAWTELNIGRSQAALVKIQAAVLLAKNAGNAALHKDLMRDYATILARNSFNAQDVDKFVSYSPEADRAENLKFLGEEAERLGNKRGTLLIWTQYRAQDKRDIEEAAEIQMKLAQNYYDLNNYAQTLTSLDQVVKAINAGRCADCKKATSDFRSLLIVWNKKEKTAPSKNLTQAYAKYLQIAPGDFEVIVWAGQVARDQKDLRSAYTFYEQAAYLAFKQNKPAEAEMTSITAIEIAETLKDTKIHKQALQNYLRINPNGSRRHLVLYQLADLSYQAKDYNQAARELKNLALDKSWKDTNLRIQTADLSLDALRQTDNKDKDSEIRELAMTYAKEFKNKQSHFSEIARRVTINRVVSLAKADKADTNALKSEVTLLKGFSVAHLPTKDRIAHLKTQILAAEKIGDLYAVETGSRQLLAIKEASDADIEFAQKSLLWIYELKLDFKNAYSLAQKMKMSDLRKDQRLLRIGLLAELANLNPEPHFRQYIAIAQSKRNANEIRVKLIRRSKNQWREYDKMFKDLKATPDLLARIALELHLAKPNLKKVKSAVAVRGVYQTPEGQYMANLLKRDEFNNFAKTFKKTHLNAASDRALKRSIQERIRLLDRLNQRYTAALRGGDLSLQIMTLNTIASENRRFYNQINALPVPRGLNKKERELYKKMLLEQSAPFAQAAKLAEEKRQDFFNSNDKAVNDLLKLVQSEDKTLRAMAMSEYHFLKGYISKSLRNDFESAIRDLQVNPKKFAQARRDIEKDPLDPNNLEELRELERKRANGPLIAYLDERIAQLKNGARR